MTNTSKYLLRGLATLIASAALASAAPILTTTPSSGALSASPSGAVGFGLTLNYSGPDFIVLNDSSFTGSNVYGSYKDYILNQFIVAGPSPESASITVPFSLGSTGLGEFDIFSTSPAGKVITGNIVIDYSLFSQDPTNPNFDPASLVSNGQLTDAVQVTIGNASATPEPADMGLLAGGLLGLALLRRRLV